MTTVCEASADSSWKNGFSDKPYQSLITLTLAASPVANVNPILSLFFCFWAAMTDGSTSILWMLWKPLSKSCNGLSLVYQLISVLKQRTWKMRYFFNEKFWKNHENLEKRKKNFFFEFICSDFMIFWFSSFFSTFFCYQFDNIYSLEWPIRNFRIRVAEMCHLASGTCRSLLTANCSHRT